MRACVQLAGSLAPVFVVCQLSLGQSVPPKQRFEVEAGTFLSTSASNPFWIRSNQYGEVPLESQGFTIRVQVKKDYAPRSPTDKKQNRLSYGYGIRAVVNTGTVNQFLLSELYGKVRYGAFEFYAGRRREIVGLVDTTQSAGSYIWSGNALPVPKVEISIPNYTPILKNGLISIKGNYAHSWLGTSDSVSDYYLHQKSLYVRLGKPSYRFKVYGGLNHQVQWGGNVLYPRVDNGVLINKFGSDWETYVYVVTAKSLYSLDSLVVKNNAASAEGGNRVGNHLGTIDLAVEYETTLNKWFFYRQSIYEAGALFYLVNISDGLHGLSFSRKRAKTGILKVVLEYLQTSNQGGPYSSGRAKNPYIKGYEDYMNNGRYIDGWVYQRQTIGTPFIMPLRYTTGLPETLDKNPYRIVNNRVQAVTLSVQSRVKQFDLLTRLSVSRNLGNYEIPLDVSQLSAQQQVIFPYKDYTFTAVLAYDNAGLLKQNLGVRLLAKRSF